MRCLSGWVGGWVGAGVRVRVRVRLENVVDAFGTRAPRSSLLGVVELAPSVSVSACQRASSVQAEGPEDPRTGGTGSSGGPGSARGSDGGGGSWCAPRAAGGD